MTEKFIGSTLTELLKNNYHQTEYYANFSEFIFRAIDKISHESVTKEMKQFFGRSLKAYISEEKDFE